LGSSSASVIFSTGFGFVEKDSFDCCFAGPVVGLPKNFLLKQSVSIP
jgi:hypothetical protein